MRTLRNAILNFGLIYVPVGVASASKKNDVVLKTLHVDCGQPIKEPQFCPVCDMSQHRDGDLFQVVKGYEVSKGQFVTFTADEVDALKKDRNATIELTKFVAKSDIEPNMIERRYYLTPNATLKKPYEVLSAAITDTGMVGIGSSCLWGKEQPVAVESVNGVLYLIMLYCADQLVPDAEITAVLDYDLSDGERELAVQLVELKAGDLEVEDLTSESRERFMEAVQARIQGKEFSAPEPEPTPEPTSDTLSALKASVEEAKRRKEVSV